MPGRKGPPRTIPLNDFGKRIRPLIEARFQSREAFLREVTVSAATLHRYETTDRRPTGRTLLRMSDALGVTPAHLLTGRADAEHLAARGYGDLFDHARAMAIYLLKKYPGDWRTIPPEDRIFFEELVALHPIIATLSVARGVARSMLPLPRHANKQGWLGDAHAELMMMLALRDGTVDHRVAESVGRAWRFEMIALIASRPDLAHVFEGLPPLGPIGEDPWRQA